VISLGNITLITFAVIDLPGELAETPLPDGRATLIRCLRSLSSRLGRQASMIAMFCIKSI